MAYVRIFPWGIQIPRHKTSREGEANGRTARTDTRRCRRSNINLCLPSRWVCKGIPKAIFSRKAPVIGTMHSVFREADFVRPCQTGLQIPLRGGWGISIPAAVTVPKETASDQCIREGWALKCSKKVYRFNAQQKAYLDAKFAIGQTTGKKLDGDTVAREMRRALGPDGVRLFRISEFLTPQQISAYFSRRAAKIRQQPPNDADIRAREEEDNFARARETVMAISLQHTITFDQYDICDMAKDGSLERLKLSMLQSICQKLELEVPSKPIRRKKSIWT